MINFRLFGIPVLVEPWFWLMAFLFSGGASGGLSDRYSMISVGLMMLVIFFSVLVHEFGHALSGRRLGGGAAHIKLWAMGGLAYNRGGRFTPKTRLAMILAGPGAGFLLLAIVVAGIMIRFPGYIGLDILNNFIRGTHLLRTNEAVEFLNSGTPTVTLLRGLVLVNFWWGVINLLPVHPLDGGQAIEQLMRSRKKVYQIGMITGIIVAVVGLAVLDRIFLGVMFGFLAYRNFQAMQDEAY